MLKLNKKKVANLLGIRWNSHFSFSFFESRIFSILPTLPFLSFLKLEGSEVWAYFEISTVSIRVAMHLRQFLIDMQQFLSLLERNSPELNLTIMRKVRTYKHFRPFAEQFFTIMALQSLAPPLDDEVREMDMRVFMSEDAEEIEESYMLGPIAENSTKNQRINEKIQENQRT